MSNVDPKRVKWRCRRGLLELDAILMPFVEHRFAQLSTDEQQCFDALLHQSDPDLLAWIVQGEECPIESFHAIIAKIKTA